MNHIYIEIVLLLLIFAFLYINVFYPIILMFIAKFFNNKITDKKIKSPFDITVLIAAYNEKDYIEAAIASVYESGYPVNNIRMIVGSDGSNDGTDKIVEKLAGKYPNLTCKQLSRRGKNQVINSILPEVKTDIVILMDADTRISKGAIEKLLDVLENPEVGAAVSSLRILNETDDINAGAEGESLYQKYENYIRKKESEIYGMINAMGAFYAVKKEYLTPIPNDLCCDDLYNVFSIHAKHKRVIFVENAIVYEVRKKSSGGEMNRRIRLSSGGIFTVLAVKQLLNPKFGWSAFFITSHKLARFFLIYILLGVLAITPVLGMYDSNWYYPTIIGQILFYTFALIGKILEKFEINIKIFQLPLFFLLMCLGQLGGWLRVFKKGQSAIWE